MFVQVLTEYFVTNLFTTAYCLRAIVRESQGRKKLCPRKSSHALEKTFETMSADVISQTCLQEIQQPKCKKSEKYLQLSTRAEIVESFRAQIVLQKSHRCGKTDVPQTPKLEESSRAVQLQYPASRCLQK